MVEHVVDQGEVDGGEEDNVESVAASIDPVEPLGDAIEAFNFNAAAVQLSVVFARALVNLYFGNERQLK